MDFTEWFYLPKGRKLSEMEVCVIEKDEVEALRLVDGCHRSQAEAAKCMNISSSTIQRILEKAREKIIKAIVYGNALHIQGGNYVVKENCMPRGDGTGPKGQGCGTGRGLGRKSGNVSGQGKGIPMGQNRPGKGQNRPGRGQNRPGMGGRRNANG